MNFSNGNKVDDLILNNIYKLNEEFIRCLKFNIIDKAKINLIRMADILNIYYADENVKYINNINISNFIIKFKMDDLKNYLTILKKESNFVDSNGCTLLMHAVINNCDNEIIELILKNSTLDINTRDKERNYTNKTSLNYNKNGDKIDGTRKDMSVFDYAVQYNEKALDVLLKCDSRVNNDTILNSLKMACNLKKYNVAKLFLLHFNTDYENINQKNYIIDLIIQFNKDIKTSDNELNEIIYEDKLDKIVYEDKNFNWLKLSIDYKNYEFIEFITKYQTNNLDKDNESKKSIYESLEDIYFYIKDGYKEGVTYKKLINNYKKNFNNCVNSSLLKGFNTLKTVSSSLNLNQINKFNPLK